MGLSDERWIWLGLTEGDDHDGELAESTGLGEMIEPMTTDIVDQKELAEQLLEQAKEQNIELWSAPMGCWAS
jgi:hypothetical protein